MSNRIKEHRQRLGLTCAAVAEAAGMSTMQVNRIERGVRRLNEASARKLCVALGVTENELFCEPDGTSGEPGRRDNLHGLDVSERMLVRFWRMLPDEEKDFVFLHVTRWASQTTARAADPESLAAASR